MKRLNYFLVSLLFIVSIANCFVSGEYWAYTNLAIAFVVSTMFYENKKVAIANNAFYQMFAIGWFLAVGLVSLISMLFLEVDLFADKSYFINYVLFVIIAIVIRTMNSKRRIS